MYSEIEKIKNKIDSLDRSELLIFPLFSDLHVDSKDDENAKKLASALNAVCRELQPDFVINLGDNLSMRGRRDHILNDQFTSLLLGICDFLKENINCPLYLINGNHDGAGTDFFKPDLWNKLDIDGYADNFLTREKEKCYYYVDIPNKKTRLVFLSLPSDSDTEKEMPAPIWAFGENQLEWLKKDALNTENNVLLFTHVPFFSGYKGDMEKTIDAWTGTEVKKAYVFELSGRIDDLKEVTDIINEKNVAACFSGHLHKDCLFSPFETQADRTNPINCHQLVTKNPFPFPWQEDKYDIAFDLVLWNFIKKEITVLRFGDGDDKHLKK